MRGDRGERRERQERPPLRLPLTGMSLLTVATRSVDVEHSDDLVETTVETLTIRTEAQTVGTGQFILTDNNQRHIIADNVHLP